MFWGEKHPVTEVQLSAYIDGSAGREQTRIETHVGACAGCRETVAELRAVRRALSEAPRVRAPRSFALRQSDVARAASSASRGMTAAMPLLSGVTMVAFLAFGVLVGVDMNDTSGSSDERAASGPNPATLVGAEEGALAPSESSGDAFASGTQYAEDRSPAARNTLSLTATAGAIGLGTPFSTPVPAVGTLSTDDENMAVRVGEIAAASVGLVAGGSLAAAWWRRRA